MSFDSSSFNVPTSGHETSMTNVPRTQLVRTKRLSQAERRKLATELKTQNEIVSRAKQDLLTDPANVTAQKDLQNAQQILDQHNGHALLGCITIGADPRLHGQEIEVSIPKPLPDPMASLKSGIYPEPREESELESAIALQRVQAGCDLQIAPVAPAPVRVCYRVCPTAKQGECCPRGIDCDGAHSLAEYRPPACRHGGRCRFVSFQKGRYTSIVEKPCGFIHPSETLEAYYARSERCPPVFKRRKISRKPRVE